METSFIPRTPVSLSLNEWAGALRFGNEEEWVRRANGRDEEACARLYDQLAPKVYSLLALMLQDEREAQEVLCEIFVETWQEIPEYGATRENLFTRAILLARRKAVARLRRKRKPGKGPFSSSQQSSRADSLGQSGLPVTDRSALELAFFSGMSLPEISARLREPVEEVRLRLCRGLWPRLNRKARSKRPNMNRSQDLMSQSPAGVDSRVNRAILAARLVITAIFSPGRPGWRALHVREANPAAPDGRK